MEGILFIYFSCVLKDDILHKFSFFVVVVVVVVLKKDEPMGS